MDMRKSVFNVFYVLEISADCNNIQVKCVRKLQVYMYIEALE